MRKLILLYLTLIIGVSFVLFPPWDGTIMTPDPFPLYDFQMVKDKCGDLVQTGIALETYAYMIGEHLVLIILMGLIASESTKYKTELWVLFGLFFTDLIDFLITYNSNWGDLRFTSTVPVSMNTISFTIFGLTILNAWIRNLLK